ncbi:MAG: CPBP family intramembrane metalloprotease [Myxococcales bacterium]
MPERSQRSLSLFGALALLVLTVALMIGLGAGLAALSAFSRDTSLAEAERHVRGSLLNLTLIQAAAMGTSLLLGLRLMDPESELPDALSLRPVASRTLGLCLLAGACLQFPLTELSNLLHGSVFGPDPLEQQLALQNLLEARTLGQGAVVILCLAGVIPLMEELLFRGIFMFGLSRRYGPAFGILLSSVLFGVVHLGAVPALYATVAGVLLGWLALATRSVWPGVALHGAFNAVPVLLPEHLVAVRGFNVPSLTTDHLPHYLVWPPLLLGLGLLFAITRLEGASSEDGAHE